MEALCRRHIRFILPCLILLIPLPTPAQADAESTHAKQRVRRSLYDFVRDPNKLKSLVTGVAVMKSRNTAPKDSALYRTSWEYWASIHGYAGSGDRSGMRCVSDPTKRAHTAKEIRDCYKDALGPTSWALLEPYFAALRDAAPPDELAKSVWGTCEHGTAHFFTWHRMYLYFFERVLRAASGDPEFALPYWDYTNPMTDRDSQGNVKRAQRWRIPDDFTNETIPSTGDKPLPNPLYEPRRVVGFGGTVDPNLEETNIDSVLNVEKFVDRQPNPANPGQTIDQGFQRSLDGGLHGYIHCMVGSACIAPYMGVVAVSANDPVFYHHHANVDRLWSCWMNRWGKNANPTKDTDWMNKTFTFVNEAGEPASMQVSELFKPDGRVDYSYDHEKDCTREPVPPGAIASVDGPLSAKRLNFDLAVAQNIRIDIPDKTISLGLPTAAGSAAESTFTAVVRPTVLAPSRALLRLSNVRAEHFPAGSVAVYLANAKNKRRSFVGVLSFFSAFAHAHDHAGHTDAEGLASSLPGQSYSFDVSAQLRELFSEGSASEGLEVAFVDLSRRQEVQTEQLRLLDKSGIRISEIKLEVETATMQLELAPK
jgi:hypothetical protein